MQNYSHTPRGIIFRDVHPAPMHRCGAGINAPAYRQAGIIKIFYISFSAVIKCLSFNLRLRPKIKKIFGRR